MWAGAYCSSSSWCECMPSKLSTGLIPGLHCSLRASGKDLGEYYHIKATLRNKILQLACQLLPSSCYNKVPLVSNWVHAYVMTVITLAGALHMSSRYCTWYIQGVLPTVSTATVLNLQHSVISHRWRLWPRSCRINDQLAGLSIQSPGACCRHKCHNHCVVGQPTCRHLAGSVMSS